MALETVKVSISWAQQFDLNHRGNKQLPSTNAPQTTMANTWVNLFIDGAVTSGTGSPSTGGVLQDQHGSWILGFNHCLRHL